MRRLTQKQLDDLAQHVEPLNAAPETASRAVIVDRDELDELVRLYSRVLEYDGLEEYDDLDEEDFTPTSTPMPSAGTIEGRTALALGPKPFHWGEVQSVAALVTLPSRLLRLMVPSQIGRFYLVEQVKTGELELLTGSVTAQMFGENAHGLELTTPSMASGQCIQITARAVRPPRLKWFTIAWWRRWFTREGWADRVRRRPPPFQAALIIATLRKVEDK